MSEDTGAKRVRTNILKNAEQSLIHYLCGRIPAWVTPDMLTAVGFLGSIVIFGGLYFGDSYRVFLLLSIIGLGIHWFGDSLDGRIAYYRNTPRKWYGFSLDIMTDWTATFIIALGFYAYLDSYKIVPLLFVAAYAGSIIIALLRYKITNVYSIDSFYVGPTEVRVLLAIVLFVEMFRDDTLLQAGVVGTVLLLLVNLYDGLQVLKHGDVRDAEEREAKAWQAEPESDDKS